MKKVLFVIMLFFSIGIWADEGARCKPLAGETEYYSPVFLLSMGIKMQSQANHANSKNPQQVVSLHKKAIQYFHAYIQCAKENAIPVNSSTYYLKATSHFEIREWNECSTDLDTSLALSNNQYKDALILKSRLLIKQNKFKQAADLLESVISFYSEDSDLLYFLGSLSAEVENYPKAILYFTSLYNLIQKKEGDAKYRNFILKYLGDIYSKKGDGQRAIHYYKLYLKYKENDPEVFFTLAQIYITLGDFNESRIYLNKILKTNPDSKPVIQLLAEMHFIENKMFSLSYFENLHKEGKFKEEGLLASIYKVLVGKHKEAEEYFVTMSSKNPGRLSLRMALIIIYSKLKKTPELASELKITSEIAYANKQYNLAIELAMQLLDISLNNPDLKIKPVLLYDFIATCYEDSGAPFLGIHYLRKALDTLESDSERINLTLHMANIYRNSKVKRYDESNKILQPILKSENPNAYFIQGMNYFSMEQYKESIESFSNAIAIDAKNPNYYFFRASAYEKNKQLNETIQDLKKSLELDNTNAATYNFLGYLYAENNMELVDAYNFIKKAVELEPDNGSYQDSLGWVLFKMEKLKESLHHLNLALQIMTDRKEDDPVVYDHLGDVFFKMNDMDNASENWKKSVEIQSSPMEKEKILQKIKKLGSSKS
ncbi:MAG TPA: tetratricopeptide repeat protein [Leptospiraceae bacterium]|nr:tetratricopeptide repeat protein [Leptospiraceae bacterium]HMW03547.1 tetratricopeptide repeat protein [Leptospiraceae bacterium]HMX34022.1 tetratricopeptide repeat protein [Leptospiraceae bacterium]HMY29532.1 tetratricopeptide repeat protein [Leptospiraceae bacterium]HMZ64828.1 tetratricopeptide repeat protein [Leptospiraceae bacterium]